MCGTHLVAEEHHSYEVPVIELESEDKQNSIADDKHTNLMATCWLLRRLVPSKITPKEPSPIFLPTR
jgi:hypothetical protein